MEAPSAVVILLGGGAGRRVGADQPKAFLPIGGRPMLAVSAAIAAASSGARTLIVTFPPGWEQRARTCLGDVAVPVVFVEGGESRQDSVRAALSEVPDGDVVIVHDAARPFASAALFGRVLAAMEEGVDAAIPVVPVADTVVRVRGGVVSGTEPREELALAQTPQAFRTSVLREAHARAEASGFSFTDDASVMEWAGFGVRAVAGEPANVKITTSADLTEADRRLSRTDG